MNRKLAKLIKNLNVESKALIRGLLESPIQWDLVSFFEGNPFSIHTARGLANIVGRRPEQVFDSAETLAKEGVLKRVCENGDASSIYAYEPSDDQQAVIRALIELNDEDSSLLDELLRVVKGETALA